VPTDGAVDFIIASQNLIPSQTFWPYRSLFEHLRSDDTRATAEQLLDIIGKFYSKQENRPEKVEVPYSLLKVEGARRVADHVRTLSAELRAHGASVTGAAKKSCPGDPALLDIARFCDELPKDLPEVRPPPAISKRRCRSWSRMRPAYESAFNGVSLFYHPGYGMESPVRDSAPYGVYKRCLLNVPPMQWLDIAYQNTTISQLADRRRAL
jgi:hypothetical protein